MKNRIIGIDVARALAIFGMILVNFKIVFGANGNDWIKKIAGVFDGKAAATFVVLAGVGIALMTKSAIENHDLEKIKKAQTRLVKRAIFLFVAGLSYNIIWPADILHFYGIYMLVTVLLLKSTQKIILFSSILMILIYPILMVFLNYETGWDFSTLEYQDFWTFQGFFRNLFYNGFHPVIPWTAFMLIGLWFGRQNLNDEKFVKKAVWISLVVFVLVQIFSYVSISMLSDGSPKTIQDLHAILGSSPMPPLPIYMISGSSIAVFIISTCILICKKYENSKIIGALDKTGQLALTFYVAHVIIGMGIVEVINPSKMGTYSIEFSVVYALIFSSLCVVFALAWTRFNKSGPLEWIMRKLSD